jgi:hypothetical protein
MQIRSELIDRPSQNARNRSGDGFAVRLMEVIFFEEKNQSGSQWIDRTVAPV